MMCVQKGGICECKTIAQVTAAMARSDKMPVMLTAMFVTTRSVWSQIGKGVCWSSILYIPPVRRVCVCVPYRKKIFTG